MEAQTPLQQEEEEEEYNLKVEVEEGEVGLLRRPSTTRRHGVIERDVPGDGNVSTTSSSTSNNGTNAGKEPEAEQEWVEEVNEGKNGVEEHGPETEAEQEPGEEVTNAETIGSFREQRPDDNDGEGQEAAPEPDEVDDNENGKGDVALLAPAARTELDTDNGVEGQGSTWTNINVHFDDERGTESIQTIVKTECSDIEQVSYETETVHETSDVATQRFSAFLSSQVDLQDRRISGDERFLDSALLSPRKSSEEKNTYSKDGKVVEEVDLIEELNPEETGFDVEKVLEKQNTHDLYCPNCHSCITRRVILRRKKWKVRNVRDRVNSDKVEKTTASELHAQPVTVVEEDRSVDAIASIDEFPTPAVTDNIPRAELNGYHNDREREAFRCLSCFSIFIPTGDGFKLFRLFGERKEVDKVQDPSEAPVAKSSTFFPFFPPWKGKTVIQQEASQTDIEHGDSTAVIGKSADQEVLVSSTEGTSVTIEAPSDKGLLDYKVTQPREVLEKETLSPLKDVTNDWKKESSINTEQDPERGKAEVAVAETTPTIDIEAPEEVPLQTGTQMLAEEPQVAQVHQPHEWDIVKSIVYGGLMESIASLGVVSSAAGAGASTLNTLGLGLANLFGGLLLIVHNLRELKNEQASEGTEQVDRYQEVLGKRQHFPLHATVAILSFIIFGCVAPITYAFSFRESDDRDYKLAAVAGASLFCILLLALGKAHVRKPPKNYLKTVLYYVITGFMASGVSFLVGELIDKLLTKLGWFDSTSSLSGTRPLQTGMRQSGWATY